MTKFLDGHELLPTLVCSWCKQVLRIGAPEKISHGICAPCASTFFGRRLPVVLPV